MRVLVIGSDRSVFREGSESRERQVAYAERFDTWDIIVFSLSNHRLRPTTLSVGVHAHPSASHSRLMYGIDAFRIARSLPRPDVVTVQDPFEAGLIGFCIALFFRVPLHVQVHTDLFASAFAQSLFNRFRLVLARFVLKRATRIRVVSDRIRKGIVAKYHPRAPITVLPIFVDRETYMHAQAGHLIQKFTHFRKKLLVVARLEKEKNVSLAIESFAQVAPKDACLIIVGDGSERKTLEKRASKNVFFEGQQTALPYYALADLVLVPSLYEGYGRTIVEALAAGKPVLATDVGVAREAGAMITAPENFQRPCQLV